MFARLALDRDEDAVVGLARMQVEETLTHLRFNEGRCRATFRRALDTACPTLFVAEDQREVVGYLLAFVHDYAMADGRFAHQEVIYVRPDKRGTRAAAHLITLFNRWADRIDATEVFTGVANGFKADRTARFLEHFGFVHVGAYLRRIQRFGT